jgi:hypothetical protein
VRYIVRLIKHDVNEGGIRKDICDGSKGREISPREWPVKAASGWTKLFEHKLRETL